MWLSLMVTLAGSRVSWAQVTPGEVLPTPGAKSPPAPVTLSLADCLHNALDHQPRLAAARASLAAAEDGCRALDNLVLAAVIDREIPIRRRQASLGVAAAAAWVDEVEHETAAAVTRAYFTVVYAREQEAIAKGLVDRLAAIKKAAEDQLKGGARDVTKNDVDRAAVYGRLAEAKRVQANFGVQRALASLREAIGLDCGTVLEIGPGRLPEMAATLCREDVIAAALARRGEMIRAGVFVDVTCLEVEAQSSCLHKKKETFAAGSDIHATPIPPEIPGTELLPRPGAIPPEMPTLLIGSRNERMKHALSLNARARAVLDVVHNLLVLEAEDALLRWQEVSTQLPEARQAALDADALAKSLNDAFTAQGKVKVEDMTNARVLAAQARAQYNEYLYKGLQALIDLERITSGAFCANLVEALGPRVQAEGTK
jgi:outer membrane protein TolC